MSTHNPEVTDSQSFLPATLILSTAIRSCRLWIDCTLPLLIILHPNEASAFSPKAAVLFNPLIDLFYTFLNSILPCLCAVLVSTSWFLRLQCTKSLHSSKIAFYLVLRAFLLMSNIYMTFSQSVAHWASNFRGLLTMTPRSLFWIVNSSYKFCMKAQLFFFFPPSGMYCLRSVCIGAHLPHFAYSVVMSFQNW